MFTLVISTGETSTTLTSYRINFINEDNAGSIFLGLGENITDTGGTNSNKHFYEFGTGDGDERNTSFTGNGLGKKSLT